MFTTHSHDDAPDEAPASTAAPVSAGPRWYRRRIRLFGPLLGLVPMLVFGAVALGALSIGDGRLSGAIGLVTGVAAAPGLLVAGAPLADSATYPLAVAGSVPLWLLLGTISSRRAASRSLASWRDYWGELSFLALAVVIGALAALIVATLVLGEALVL